MIKYNDENYQVVLPAKVLTPEGIEFIVMAEGDVKEF